MGKYLEGIYAGSFDPIHAGHISVIEKALKIFDKLYVIVSINPDKNNCANLDQRFNHVKKMLKKHKNIEVLKNGDDLIANIAKKLNVRFLIRSARDIDNYQNELTIAAANNSLYHELETILIIPDYDKINYSSTLIRHLKALGKKNVKIS